MFAKHHVAWNISVFKDAVKIAGQRVLTAELRFDLYKPFRALHLCLFLEHAGFKIFNFLPLQFDHVKPVVLVTVFLVSP